MTLVGAWRAAVFAGLVTAIVSIAIETPIVWLLKGEMPWAAARMTAAMLLGPEVLHPRDTFHFGLVALACVMHLALSAMYGLILAAIIHGWPRTRSALAGAVFGLLLYFVNLHGFAPLLFPWFVELQNGITVFSHIVFGAVLGISYCVMLKRTR